MDSMHDQGGQMSGGGYQPMDPSYGPPPKKKGFNWLACCGISCGVLLVVGIIVAVSVGNIFNRFMGDAMKVAMEIQSTDAATIRSSAQHHDATSVAASPESYTKDWVAMDCVVMSPEDFGKAYFGGSDNGDFDSADFSSASGQDGTMYFVEGGFMVIDISKAASKAEPGDHIVAYGKPFNMDFSAIPGVGDEMPEELENLKMFMAKEVDKTMDAAEGMAEEGDMPQGGPETGSSDSWGQ
ncbi:MAG: hypothetical protein R3F46_16495 [bacterium]